MKRFTFLFLAIVSIVGIIAISGCKKDEKPEKQTTGELNSRTWVDLGLPSGTKWATCNVGADSPESFGKYFAWGETTPKSNYDWSTYRWCNGSDTTLTKYCDVSEYGNNGFSDNLSKLETTDDVVKTYYGNNWRMPTADEMKELVNNCTIEMTTENGIEGRKFIGPNGNFIFLPAAGCRSRNDLNSGGGFYWSSSLVKDVPNSAWRLRFGSLSCNMDNGVRFYGFSVRPVVAQ